MKKKTSTCILKYTVQRNLELNQNDSSLFMAKEIKIVKAERFYMVKVDRG